LDLVIFIPDLLNIICPMNYKYGSDVQIILSVVTK
jgi:hypothetical protein